MEPITLEYFNYKGVELPEYLYDFIMSFYQEENY